MEALARGLAVIRSAPVTMATMVQSVSSRQLRRLVQMLEGSGVMASAVHQRRTADITTEIALSVSRTALALAVERTAVLRARNVPLGNVVQRLLALLTHVIMVEAVQILEEEQYVGAPVGSMAQFVSRRPRRRSVPTRERSGVTASAVRKTIAVVSMTVIDRSVSRQQTRHRLLRRPVLLRGSAAPIVVLHLKSVSLLPQVVSSVLRIPHLQLLPLALVVSVALAVVPLNRTALSVRM